MSQDRHGYDEFIVEMAPYAYAHAYLLTGEFDDARALLEVAFERGRDRWDGWHAVTAPTDIARELLADHARTLPGHVSDEPAPGFSFSKSRKLTRFKESLAVLDELEGDERIAAILLFVEEVDDDRVLRWLGREPGFLERLRSRVEASTNSRRDAFDDPSDSPVKVFARALGRYRLPDDFVGGLVRSTRLPEGIGTTKVSGKRVAIPVALIVLGLLAIAQPTLFCLAVTFGGGAYALIGSVYDWKRPE